MSSKNVEVVRSAFEAYQRGDVPDLVELVHPDVEVHPALVGGLEGTVYRGREGYKQFVEDVDAGHTWGEGREGIVVDAPGGRVLGMRDGRIHRFQSFNTWEETLEAARAT